MATAPQPQPSDQKIFQASSVLSTTRIVPIYQTNQLEPDTIVEVKMKYSEYMQIMIMLQKKDELRKKDRERKSNTSNNHIN